MIKGWLLHNEHEHTASALPRADLESTLANQSAMFKMGAYMASSHPQREGNRHNDLLVGRSISTFGHQKETFHHHHDCVAHVCVGHLSQHVHTHGSVVHGVAWLVLH